MAIVHVELSKVQERSLAGGALPVADSVPVSSETLTTVATVATGAIAPASEQGVWSVTARDAAVWIKFGVGVVDAAVGPRRLLMAGQTRDFGVTAVGEHIAIKEA